MSLICLNHPILRTRTKREIVFNRAVKSHASYQLIVQLKKEKRIVVGKLGVFNFPYGFYIYTGSAVKNLESRITRHVSNCKKLHWHIDYLLSDPHAEIIEINTFSIDECPLNKETPGHTLINKFGASDCKNRCRSHLKYLGISK